MQSRPQREIKHFNFHPRKERKEKENIFSPDGKKQGKKKGPERWRKGTGKESICGGEGGRSDMPMVEEGTKIVQNQKS